MILFGRPIRRGELLAPRDNEHSPYLTEDGHLKPGLVPSGRDMKIEGTGRKDAFQVTLYLKELVVEVPLPTWAIDSLRD